MFKRFRRLRINPALRDMVRETSLSVNDFIYLRQEGRNIGLLNKINAYNLQDKGFDTIEANHQLGFKADERTYEVVDFILNHYGIKEVNLLTNNPLKLHGLSSVKIVKRVPIVIKPNKFNEGYLKVKKEQMGHIL